MYNSKPLLSTLRMWYPAAHSELLLLFAAKPACLPNKSYPVSSNVIHVQWALKHLISAIWVTYSQILIVEGSLKEWVWLTRCEYHIPLIRCCDYYLRVASVWDTNNCWIRHVWAIQWRLLDTISSTHSLSVLLSAMETVLVVARWS